MENGGVLTASISTHGMSAQMHWKGHKPIVGGAVTTTMPDALTSLNTALEDDAAGEGEC